MWWDVAIVVMVTSDKANIARLHSFITLIESSPSPQPPRHPMSMPAIMAEIQETLSGLTFPTRRTGWSVLNSLPCEMKMSQTCSNSVRFCQLGTSWCKKCVSEGMNDVMEIYGDCFLTWVMYLMCLEGLRMDALWLGGQVEDRASLAAI